MKPHAQLLVTWLGISVGIFGVALLIDHFIFGDSGWGTYKPISHCNNPGSSCPIYSKPLIYGIEPFLGIVAVIIGPILLVYGKLAYASSIGEREAQN